jgi:hypothetical protein
MSMEEYELYDRSEPALDGVERDIYDAISADVPWELVERFADLERVSGSADEREAAEYVLDRLDEFGVSHERYDPELYLSVPESASLRTTTPEAETFDAVKTVSFSPTATVAGELQAVGGSSAESHDDLLGAELGDISDVEGAVAVLDGLLPIDAIHELDDAGAAAVIVVHPHECEPHEGIATPIWGGAPEPGQEDLVPDVPILTVSRTVGDRLYELLETGPVEVELETETTTGWRECPVVVARIPGEADPDDDDFVLLHGHYDSWHVGVADNATGDAGLLESARVFEEFRDELKRDLWVAWWPGHSTGRYAGSAWFAEEFALDIEERCIAQVNMDSPGAVDATEFEDMVVWMPEADGLARGAIDDVAGKEARENRPPRAGDYSFNNLGVSGLFMLSSNIPEEVREARGYHAVGGCGGHADAWHLTTDTLDKADPDVLVRDIRVYATAVARLLREDVPPLDHRHTVERHRDIVAEYDDESPFDLAPVRSELDELAAAVEELYADVEAGRVDPETATDAVRRLSRRLVRVNFCTEGPFEQDPATDRPPYPSLEPATDLGELSGDDRKFLEVQLRRARNDVVHRLRAAREELP